MYVEHNFTIMKVSAEKTQSKLQLIEAVLTHIGVTGMSARSGPDNEIVTTIHFDVKDYKTIIEALDGIMTGKIVDAQTSNTLQPMETESTETDHVEEISQPVDNQPKEVGYADNVGNGEDAAEAAHLD